LGKSGGEKPLRSFTIVTTAAAPELAWLHHRMPAVLAIEDAARWLAPGEDAAAALACLRPDAAGLTGYAVSRLVNRVGNDGPECVEPLAGAGG